MNIARFATILGSATAFAVTVSAVAHADEEGAAPKSEEAAPAPTYPAHPKGEPLASFGGAAGSSTWRGDPAGFAALKLGYRFKDFIAPYYLGRNGYAVVNDRTLTALQFGVQVWGRIGTVRPYVRLGGMHQHEESQQAVRADPGGALFGVGDGIRHRWGGEGALGFDWPFFHHEKFALVATVEAVGDYFGDQKGPGFYVFGAAGLGATYALF